MPSTPRLVETLKRSPIIRLKGYDYFVHPITDGIPRLEPKLLEEVVDALVKKLPKSFDVILTPEAMGIPISSVLSLRTGKPFTVARKRAYGTPGEIVVAQRTGYGASLLHVHGLAKGDRVVIVDDVVSSGGTLHALGEACRQIGVDLVRALVVINKGHDLAELSQRLGCPVECLITLRIINGHVQLET
ncbi:MAG TPA: hypoxanthine/guanine phosphoribosyltransferase [Candidatus Thermoplasmatota archaeon]